MRSGSTGVGSIDAGLGRGDADGAGHAASLLVGLAVGLRARGGSRETDGAVPMGGTGRGGRKWVPSLWGGRKERKEKRERERAGVKHETCLLTIFEAIGLGSIVSTGST